MILALMMVMTIAADAMPYKQARNNALFLSDKKAHELSLTAEQYEAVYEINLDYLMCLELQADIFGICWERRNADLRLVLSVWQYEKFLALEYFYRPVRWVDDAWLFAIYEHYKKSEFFFARPKAFKAYKGGHNQEAADFYATRIAEKPATAEHSNPPAPRQVRPAESFNGNRPGGFGAPAGRPMGGMGGRPMGGPGRMGPR